MQVRKSPDHGPSEFGKSHMSPLYGQNNFIKIVMVVKCWWFPIELWFLSYLEMKVSWILQKTRIHPPPAPVQPRGTICRAEISLWAVWLTSDCMESQCIKLTRHVCAGDTRVRAHRLSHSAPPSVGDKSSTHTIWYLKTDPASRCFASSGLPQLKSLTVIYNRI